LLDLLRTVLGGDESESLLGVEPLALAGELLRGRHLHTPNDRQSGQQRRKKR
jgi:hypothetical protein